MKKHIQLVLLLVYVILLNGSMFIVLFNKSIIMTIIGMVFGLLFCMLLMKHGKKPHRRKYKDGDCYIWQVKLSLGSAAVIIVFVTSLLITEGVTTNMIVLLLLILNTGVVSVISCKSSSIYPPFVIILLCLFISKYSQQASVFSLIVALFYLWCVFMINIDTRVWFFSFFTKRAKKTYRLKRLQTDGYEKDFIAFWNENHERIMAISLDSPQNMCVLYRMDEGEKFIECRLSDGEKYRVINPKNLGKFLYFDTKKLNGELKEHGAQAVIKLADSILSSDSNFTRCSSIGAKRFIGYKRIN